MLELTLLCAFAFCAGMIDAVVGGGGLIQIPALINVFPEAQDATLFGTNKFSSVWGTSVAARSYVGKVTIPWNLVLPAALSSFVMAFLVAAAVLGCHRDLAEDLGKELPPLDVGLALLALDLGPP